MHLLFHGLTGNTNGFFTPVVVLKNYRRRSKVTRTLVTFGISILWARFPLHGVVTFEGSLLWGSKKVSYKVDRTEPFFYEINDGNS